MNPIPRLRYKIATSFIIAALGLVMSVHLAGIPGVTLLDFVAPAIFVIAGTWRGLIFVNAVRSLAKT